MNVVVVSVGAVVVSHKEQTWLFGTPSGIKEGLDAVGIDVPDIVFNTSLSAPGIGELGKPVVRYKSNPLVLESLKAEPVQKRHGTDYIITADDGSTLLFSERGDVAVKDTEDVTLAIIKNKHVAKGYGDNVIHWPWPDAEYSAVASEFEVLRHKAYEPEAEDEIGVKETVPGFSIGQPDQVIKRFGDTLTAALHTAYNDVSDHFFSEGYLSQDERMEVAHAVGPALDALRSNLSESLLTKDITYSVPMALKEMAPNVPDTLTSPWLTIYKDNDGIERWASISSVAMWDNHDEYFTEKAMDWAIAFGKLTGFKGPLRYRHIPGLDGGVCDSQARVGNCLFESGTFNDTPIGLAMKRKFKEGVDVNTTEKPWQVSLGLAYAKTDLVDGTYKRAAIFERSMTQRPAVPVTIISMKESEAMKIMTDEQLNEAATELGLELTEVKTMYERAMAQGNLFQTKEELEVALKESGMGGANATNHENDTEDLDIPQTLTTKEDLVELFNNLTEEDWKQVEEALLEVVGADSEVDTTEKAEKKDGKKKYNFEKGAGDANESDESDEDDEDEEDDKGKTKTKEVEPEDKFDKLMMIVTKQAESIAGLTAAVADSKVTDVVATPVDQTSVKEAARTELADLLSGLSRQQAVSVVTKTTEPVLDVDDEDMLAKLKEADAGAGGSMNKGVYNLFTSKTLNQKN